MKRFKFIITGLLVFAMTFSSCDLFDLDINEDPNNPAVAASNLALTQIEIDIMNNLASTEGSLETFMGLMGTQATSRYDLNNNSFVGLWTNFYSGPAKDVNDLIAASEGSPYYLGIAKVLKAYMFASLVDLYGDIPYSEAGQGDALSKIVNPKFDDDATIYPELISLVESAITDLAGSSPVALTGDIIYANNITRWRKLANSMLLKLLITSRKAIPENAGKIRTLITENNLINTAAEDFNFTFSKDPTSIRHPWYTGAYTGGEFDFTYINNEFSVESLIDGDPRWPFQFRRQTNKVLNIGDPTERSTIPCVANSCTYGYVVLNQTIIDRLYRDKGLTYGPAEEAFLAGIFGRDRGDGDGIPADGSLRLIPGVYPAGGFYDVATPGIPAANRASGGGIYPALTGVNMAYYKIEAILELGVPGDARQLLADAIRGHISRVVNFGIGADVNSVAPSSAAIDAYVDVWLERYDAAPSNAAKLNVALKQLWFSSFGNGFELYNVFRRTGFPSQIQQHVSGTVRGFPLKLPYPQNELTLNPEASSYVNVAFDAVPVFWDVD